VSEAKNARWTEARAVANNLARKGAKTRPKLPAGEAPLSIEAAYAMYKVAETLLWEAYKDAEALLWAKVEQVAKGRMTHERHADQPAHLA